MLRLEKYSPQKDLHQIPKEYKKLLASILGRAIEDLKAKEIGVGTKNYSNDYIRSREKHRKDAYSWIFSDAEVGKQCFSFLQICDYLDLDPKRIREMLEV